MIIDLVSIIMPAYKTKNFIGEAIESVIAQTYPHWELLITDDCSPDDLRSVVTKYAEKDSRIKYYRAEKNGGPALARNNSLNRASGQYIAFLDSDDLWNAHKLEKQIQFMKDKESAFSYTEYQRIQENGTPYSFINTVPEQITYKQLLKNTAIATLTVILDRSRLPTFQLRPGWGYDDYVLWLELLRSGTTAQGLKLNLAKYRVMNSSVSSNKWRALKWVWNIYRFQQKHGFFRSSFYLMSFIFNATTKRYVFISTSRRSE